MLHVTSIGQEPPASARWSGCIGGTTVSEVGVARSGVGVAKSKGMTISGEGVAKGLL